MEILRELTRIQHERGWLDDDSLRALSRELRVPLYRLEGLVSFYPAFRRSPPPKSVVHVCRDVVCRMASRADSAAARYRLNALAAAGELDLEEVSCLGRCDSAPAVMVNDEPIAPATLGDEEVLLEWLDKAGSRPNLNVVARKWKCDVYRDGAPAYETARSLVASRELGATCIRELTASGLRGMGGAGFPTGRKWEFVASKTAHPKYVICNADESEPGTFKDRVILEQLPHLVIEGMLLAGLTTGAEQGMVYLRHEYKREHRALQAAIDDARQLGVLGSDAAESGKAFDIELFVSPGGYILGEETALLEALEDKRGEPRNKPPYPGTHGLWGQPTLINNVETLAMATSIVHHGADWWHTQGKGDYSGLKFVSISGDVTLPGVLEIPIGTTVAELIDMAGGMRDGRPLKAFLPGGASSNFLTAEHANTPVDFEAMREAGSMLGTGAVIIISDRHDLFQLATNLVTFFRNESCGKCVPCRVGSEKAVALLDDICRGKRKVNELVLLHDLGETLEQTSICGLGQVALSPILSMMKNFPDDVPVNQPDHEH